tara:strand:- start:1211 stop:1435 length:225 start_codon:yes stop_codon:yes gene_type:complete
LILAIIYQILDTGSFSVRVVVYPSSGNSFADLVDAEGDLLGCGIAHPYLTVSLDFFGWQFSSPAEPSSRLQPPL